MKKIAAGLFLAASLPGLFAQTNNPAVRPLSLTDCFAEALKHNLDVQVQRYNPQISLYDLRAAYGGYDPVLNLSGQHDYNRSGGFFPTNAVTISQDNNFKSDLGGSLPTGTTYDLSGNVSRFRVTVTLEVKFTDLRDESVLYDSKSLDGSYDYDPLKETEADAKVKALQAAVRKLVDNTVSGW